MRYIKTVAIDLTEGVEKYTLPTQNGIAAAYLIGVYARKEGYSLKGKTIAQDVFNSFALNLRQGTTAVIENLPLPTINEVNSANGSAFPISLENITWEDSSIDTGKATDITTGQVIELVFEFEK